MRGVGTLLRTQPTTRGPKKMKIIRVAFTLALLLLFALADIQSGNSPANKSPATHGQDGTLQKMIVASGSVTMDLDLNRINGVSSTIARQETLYFAVAANSFFSVLVFNNVLRAPEPGSMELVPQNSVALPTVLTASLKRLLSKSSTVANLSTWRCAMP